MSMPSVVGQGQSWADLSDQLVIAAIVILTAALLAFAAYVAHKVRLSAEDEQTQPPQQGSPSPQQGCASQQQPTSQQQVGLGSAQVQPHRLGGVSGGQRIAAVALALSFLATVVLGVGVISRTLAVQRAPWGNMYEFSLMAALLALVIYLLMVLRWRIVGVGVVLVPLVLLGLGVAVEVLYVPATSLRPILNSPWLVIHVASVVVSFAIFGVAAAVTVLYLLRSSVRLARWVSWLPSARELDQLSYRLHAFTFPLYTFAVIAGAIWAESAWGRYWQWDPKETWSLIVWLIYALYLHARLTAGWQGKKAAVIALTAYSCFIVNYFVINLLVQGLHSYDR